MTIRPVRLRLSRARGFNLQAHSRAVNGLPAVNCARPGKWGNPFRSTAYSVAEAVALYRTAIMGAMPIAFAGGLVRQTSVVELAKAQVDKLACLPLHHLRGKNLGCWCGLCARHAAPGKPLDGTCPDCAPCHTDVLGRLANRPSCEEVRL